MLTDVGAVMIFRCRGTGTAPSTRRSCRRATSRLAGFNERIISLYAPGMTARDIQAHLRDLYRVEVSPDLISRVTDAVDDEVRNGNRPLDRVYPVVWVDGLIFKVRDEGGANRRGLSGDGHRLRRPQGGPGHLGRPHHRGSAKFWLTGVERDEEPGRGRCVMVCCDGLTGLPDAMP